MVAESRFSRRLREAAKKAQIELNSTKIDALERYFDLLARWNRTINLTSLPLEDAPAAAINRLFVEPLQAATQVDDAPLRWVDVGSGGGSPAIPLKIVRPLLHLTMVESRSRKAAFLNEATRFLELTETKVSPARIENWAESRESLDLITLRAVKTDEALARLLSDMLCRGGRLFLFGSDLAHPERFSLEPMDELALAGDSRLVILRKS